MKLVPSRRPPLSKQFARAWSFALVLAGTAANAQSMGQGLFTWATPFLALLIGAGIIIGLAMAFINPQHLAKVVWGLVIAVAIFAILRGMNGLLSAVQQG